MCCILHNQSSILYADYHCSNKTIFTLSTHASTIGTTSANSLDSDLGCTLRVNFDNVTLMSHKVALRSQKPCQYNNCSKTNGYNIPHDAINEVYIFSIKFIDPPKKKVICSVDRIMNFNRAEPTCYRANFPYASSG